MKAKEGAMEAQWRAQWRRNGGDETGGNGDAGKRAIGTRRQALHPAPAAWSSIQPPTALFPNKFMAINDKQEQRFSIDAASLAFIPIIPALENQRGRENGNNKRRLGSYE